MSYTIKNLRKTEDKAPDFGLSEIQEAHFPATELGAEETGFAFHVIHPGRRQGFAHRHEQAEEVYVVPSGRVMRATARLSGRASGATDACRALAPDRSNQLASSLREAANQLPQLREHRSQLRIADFYRQQRILERGESDVCLANRHHCVVDEALSASRWKAGRRRFEFAAR